MNEQIKSERLILFFFSLHLFNINLDTVCLSQVSDTAVSTIFESTRRSSPSRESTCLREGWIVTRSIWRIYALVSVSIMGSSSSEILRSTNLTWRDTHRHTCQQRGRDSRPREEVYFYHRQRRQIMLVCRGLYKCKLYWRAISPEKGLYVNAL